MNADEFTFFDGAADALNLYIAFKEKLSAACPRCHVKVSKTQISFSNKHVFAIVSFPRKRSERGGLTISFGLPCNIDSPRSPHSSQPYPSRWTHHVLVSREADIDAELMDWIIQAHDFAIVK